MDTEPLESLVRDKTTKQRLFTDAVYSKVRSEFNIKVYKKDQFLLPFIFIHGFPIPYQHFVAIFTESVFGIYIPTVYIAKIDKTLKELWSNIEWKPQKKAEIVQSRITGHDAVFYLKHELIKHKLYEEYTEKRLSKDDEVGFQYYLSEIDQQYQIAFNSPHIL